MRFQVIIELEADEEHIDDPAILEDYAKGLLETEIMSVERIDAREID